MAKKTKKLHPGGSVDRATPVTGTAPAPKPRSNIPTRAVQGPKLTPAQRRRMMQMLKARQRNSLMPTAGVSQGRVLTATKPMPGPAPDSARMRRMQQLMRQQQARFNRSRKNALQAARFPAKTKRMASNDARRRPKRDSRDRGRTRTTGFR